MSQQQSSLAWEEADMDNTFIAEEVLAPSLTLLMQKEKKDLHLPFEQGKEAISIQGSITISF